MSAHGIGENDTRGAREQETGAASPAANAGAAAALQLLRERFRATMSNTFAAFSAFASQLATTPAAPQVVEGLRRELHRVHGTAGSYGYMEASRLAAKVEERAIRWAADPTLDREQRATIIEHFVSALKLAFEHADTGAPAAAPPARRRMLLVALDPARTASLRAEGVLNGYAVSVHPEAEVTRETLRDEAPHVVVAAAAAWPAIAAAVGDASVPAITIGVAPKTETGAGDAATVVPLDAGIEAAALFQVAERLAMRSSVSGATVLVVDDDPSILAIVRYIVESEGIRILTLDDPSRLADALERDQPSLVLMDIRMEGYDGVELTRGLRHDARFRELPVILFSTDLDEATRQRAYDAGADEFIPKPIVPPELRRRIAARLERQRLTRLAHGLHPGTGLPLPARAQREAVALVERARSADRDCAVAVVRPDAAGAQEPGAEAWLHECQRIARGADRLRSAVGFADGEALLAAFDEEPAVVDATLRDLFASRPGGAPPWHAGVAMCGEFDRADLALLRRAAEEAADIARSDEGDRIRRWNRDDALIAPDVIVVEDDLALSEMLQYALRSGGLSYRAYGTGPEALAAMLALEPAGRKPLVLLDVDLPGLDGHSLHERLRMQRPGVYTVVFMSVHTGEAEQIRALKTGAIDYLLKPVNLRVLMTKLPVWIQRAAHPA